MTDSPAALGIADLLADPTALGQAREIINRVTPLALLDQLQRAAEQARETTGPDAEHLAPDQCPGWLHLAIGDTLTSWEAGTGATCMCGPRPDRPQPVVAATWRPRLVSCQEHAPVLLRQPRGGAPRCDGCTSTDGLRTGTITVGPLSLVFRACQTCADGWLPAEPDGPGTAGATP